MREPDYCYYCGPLRGPCSHIALGTEPLANMQAIRDMVKNSPALDLRYNPMVGFASGDIYDGDAIYWDSRTRRFYRWHI